MPRNKDLKRLVRARMKKTGEAYTAARAQILHKTHANNSASAPPRAQRAGESTIAGMRDETIAARTGRTWREWVTLLDGHDAAAMSHRDIAALLRRQYGMSSWWAQSVTVGYERIKGLREQGQRRGGSYEAGKSRTFYVPVDVLFEAWSTAAVRRRWLEEPNVVVRTATRPKSIRLGWPDGTIVLVSFIAKGPSKSTAAVTHMKLPDRAAVTRAKAAWEARLDALAARLGAARV